MQSDREARPAAFEAKQGFLAALPGKAKDAALHLFALVILAGIGFGIWSWISPKAWYVVRYQVSPKHVFIAPVPHDCDFMKAPIGRKYCHFDEVVTVMPENSPNPTDVYVTWNKVEDQ